MGSTLFGSSPSAQFQTNSSVSPQQTDILSQLTSLLQGSAPAQLSQELGQQSLQALEQQQLAIPNTITPTQSGINSATTGALTNALGYQSTPVNATNIGTPQVTNPTPVTATNIGASNIAAPQINATQAFDQGVVQPLTSDFLSQTLPAIAGQQGGSAGGAYGSGSAAARQTAATNLERTLAQQGSQFAYSAASANQNAALTAAQANQNAGLTAGKANQAAGLTAGLANQSTDLTAQTTNAASALQTGVANQGAGLTAGVANQNASNSALQRVLQAIGLAPGTSIMPAAQVGANITDTAQTYAPYQQMLADLIAGGTASTQQTSAVGVGGSSGLLGGLAGGLAGNSGVTSGIGSIFSGIFSDVRLKEDIEEVGTVDGFPLYKFRYKGTPERRLGLMAQDVEKRLPHAVGERAGYKTVDYAAVLADVLKEAK
jgi:hypothetical protein